MAQRLRKLGQLPAGVPPANPKKKPAFPADLTSSGDTAVVPGGDQRPSRDGKEKSDGAT